MGACWSSAARALSHMWRGPRDQYFEQYLPVLRQAPIMTCAPTARARLAPLPPKTSHGAAQRLCPAYLWPCLAAPLCPCVSGGVWRSGGVTACMPPTHRADSAAARAQATTSATGPTQARAPRSAARCQRRHLRPARQQSAHVSDGPRPAALRRRPLRPPAAAHGLRRAPY